MKLIFPLDSLTDTDKGETSCTPIDVQGKLQKRRNYWILKYTS